ncbi:membrane protein [Fulvitalea axinellae]|uniref:UPF0056 membrane protein n=1 Tax=Fulvitalea axinellae TaxID=1182444 RepID=A0AAU9D5J1_9BACT|nr:membrane protein [Fulvitalea axinellae]
MSDYITFAIGLLSITNPIGSTAIFASLTNERTQTERNCIARTAGLAIFCLLLLSVWTGSGVLQLFNINIHAFEVAGGIILGIMGVDMLHTRTSSVQHTEHENDEASGREDIAIVPVSIPLTVGPAAITSIIVSSHKMPTLLEKGVMSIACLGVAVIIWLCLRFSGHIYKFLGKTGMNIIVRIMGILLTSIAVEMVIKGVLFLMPGLGPEAQH